LVVVGGVGLDVEVEIAVEVEVQVEVEEQAEGEDEEEAEEEEEEEEVEEDEEVEEEEQDEEEEAEAEAEAEVKQIYTDTSITLCSAALQASFVAAILRAVVLCLPDRGLPCAAVAVSACVAANLREPKTPAFII
jgi:uncharacterized protein YaiL (DUF2058 family)